MDCVKLKQELHNFQVKYHHGKVAHDVDKKKMLILQRELDITKKALQLAMGKVAKMEGEVQTGKKNAQNLMPMELVSKIGRAHV